MKKENIYLHFLSPKQFRWFVVLLLWISHAIYFFNYNGLGVLGPLVKQELDLTNTNFGLLFSAIYTGSMAIQIPAGIWCDRFGVRKVMSWGLLLIGGSMVTFSVNRSIILLYGLLLCLGIGVGCSQVSAAISVIDWFPFRGRATAMGIKQTGINIGGILASLLLPYMIVRYPWRFVMEWVGLGTIVFAFLFYFLYKDPADLGPIREKRKFHIKGIWMLLKVKAFLLVTLSGIFLMIVQFSFSSYLVLYLNKTLKYTLNLSGIILALSFGIGAFARIGWSIASDYISKNRRTILVIIGVAGALVNVLFGLTSPSSPPWVIYLLSISFGLTGMGWNAVFLTLIGELSLRETVGLGVGVSFFLANLGVVLGPPLFGLLVDLSNSFIWSWLFLGFCMLVASFLILISIRKS